MWENSNNPRVINAARLEIARSIAANKVADGELQDDTPLVADAPALPEEQAKYLPEPPPEYTAHDVRFKMPALKPEQVNHFLPHYAPPVLDPFAGGGSIPLEAQRLGLRAYASDLNSVAVLINKALIEIPPKFANMPPVNPEWQSKSDEVQGQSFFQWLGHWYLDVLDVVFGAPATQATVLAGHAANGTLMDYGWASLEYPGRSFGQFEFNLTLPQDTVIELVVACERGELSADLKAGRWKWRGENGGWREEHAPASEPVYGFEGMRESISEFFTAIRTGRSPRANLEVVRRVQHAGQLCADAHVELR